MNKKEIEEIIDQINYKDWKFEVKEKGDILYLQIVWEAEDNYTKDIEEQKSRKWLLSKHMVRGEIVQTAFLAVKTAEEHEIRENFWYKGVLPFCPHFDIEARVEMAKQKLFEVREET